MDSKLLPIVPIYGVVLATHASFCFNFGIVAATTLASS